MIKFLFNFTAFDFLFATCVVILFTVAFVFEYMPAAVFATLCLGVEIIKILFTKSNGEIKYPDTERHILTWVRDRAGLEYWQIDSYSKNGGWFEARAWDQKVLHWQELPQPPESFGEKGKVVRMRKEGE